MLGFIIQHEHMYVMQSNETCTESTPFVYRGSVKILERLYILQYQFKKVISLSNGSVSINIIDKEYTAI